MSEIRRIHGRAIERAYQTGQDVSVCTHHGEESYYVHTDYNVCGECRHLDWTYNRGIPGEDMRICNLKKQFWDGMESTLACGEFTRGRK